MTADGARALAERLQHPRYEVLPLEGIEEAVFEHVPEHVTLTVTASPSQGLDATLAVSERLAGEGRAVVPHVSARLVRDVAHLEEVLARLRAAGIRQLFVPAGDAPEPAGEFSGAGALLAAMEELRADFTAIGITGYPESHHVISDDVTISAMFEKAEMATYIVSQICFDAGVIAGWIANVRARGMGLPIWIGVPGVVDQARLLRISRRIGLGESTRFLRHQHGVVRRLLTRQFKPDGLMRDLGSTVADPSATVAGFHFYTFNEVARMERWRQRTLEALERRAKQSVPAESGGISPQ